MSDQNSNSSVEDEVEPMSLEVPSSDPQSEDNAEKVGPMSMEVPSSVPQSEDTAEKLDTTESAQQASTSQGPSSAKPSSTPKSFDCQQCFKHFATKQSLQRHVKSIHDKKRNTTEPKNAFDGSTSKSKQPETVETKPGHKRPHNDTTNEDGELASVSEKKRKETTQNQPQSLELSTDEDEDAEDDNKDTEDEDDNVSLMDEDPLAFPFDNDGDIPEVIKEKWIHIRTSRKDGRHIQDVYNFRLYEQPKWSELQRDQLIAIFKKLHCRFKINISFGLVLRHSETNELRYFHPSYNNANLFETPFLITSRDDLMRFIDSVNEEEPLEFATHQRPSTKWSVYEITNMSVYVNKMSDLPIGCCSLDGLPSFFKNNKGLHSLIKSGQTGKVFKDNLCFFRCLALHNGSDVKNCEKETKILFGEYKKQRKIDGDNFQGISLEELPVLEKQFKTNIMVYILKPTEEDGVSNEEDGVSDESDDDDGGEGGEPVDSTNPNVKPCYRLCKETLSAENPHSKRKSTLQKEEEEVPDREDGVSGESDVDNGANGEPLDSSDPKIEPRHSQPKVKSGAKKQEQKKNFAKLVYRSRKTMKKTMLLNLFDRHFSYIKDFNLYSNTFCCANPWCQRVFRRSNGLKRHTAICSKEMKYRLPGGVYMPAPSVFDRLLDNGISVPEEHPCFPHRATFDFEIFPHTTDEKTEKASKTRVEYKHVPLSVSVFSNVPGFDEPRCFISKGDPQLLVDEMIEHLKKMSEASYKILKERFKKVFVEIDKQLESICIKGNSDSDCKLKIHLKKLRADFEVYLKELPVLGFDSAKYDINLVKQYLYTSLKKSEPLQYVIKRNNTYLAIKTKHLKFLDISNYLVQGCSSAEFLNSYERKVVKGFFPFDWMDSLEKLEHERLPPETEFNSKLKGTCLSPEDYKTCTDAWETRNMHTMRDYLEWYSTRNLAPFLDAVEKMSQFYKDKNIDMFKDGISAPGLSLRYLFQSMTGEDDFFTLIETRHKDLYHTFKDNIVGGPSIVFHRYHEKDKTKIREHGKLCKKVIGYDANALYLSCLMEEMPVGHFIRRKFEDNFQPQVSHSHMTRAIEWLEWESSEQGIKIQHKGNAREKRIGPKQIPVDGYCTETNTVYQFHGCYWHGHICELNKKEYNETLKTTMKKLREKTDETAEDICGMKYNLVEMKECEWERQKSSNEKLHEFIQSRWLPLQEKKSMRRERIIQAILDDELFGFVECDINVPEKLKEKFSEMTPIFKNIDIAFDKDVIGDHMYEYAERNKLFTKPRRNLIGSMFGKKILLTTPLLKWYLQNGLEVTKIYQVIQYRASKCFEKFGKDVSEARRDGDLSGSTARADTMKLIGNSAYGKTVTNKENFKDVKVCMTKTEASRLVNDPRFRSATDIGQDVHEVELSKRSVTVDLPLQIGLFVYQYAKLKMLQFYFEFLDKYIDRCDFQLCQMDTDSAYIAITGNDLESVIKPEMREEYEREKHKWFPRRDTPERERYDKRTPGLFKVECDGDGLVALCSKTYICFGEKDKVSSKGLNKKQNKLNKERFLDVLKTQQTGVGKNVGNMRVGEDMVTYSQQKGALSYLYIKRKVADDGVSTTYLDI